MAAGVRITPSGQLNYAGGGISSGYAYGLLDIFTDVNGATPSAGNVMFPRDYGSVNSWGYYVGGGTYRGDYWINRNNTVGESVWNNAYYGHGIEMGDYYNYIHWPTDNRYVTIWDNTNNPQDSMTFKIEVIDTNGTKTVLSDTVNAGSVYDPSSGLPYYMQNGGGSSGAYTAAAINTGWTTKVTLYDVDQNQETPIMYTVTDYDTGIQITSGNLVLNIENGWIDSFTWDQPFMSIMNIFVQSM